MSPLSRSEGVLWWDAQNMYLHVKVPSLSITWTVSTLLSSGTSPLFCIEDIAYRLLQWRGVLRRLSRYVPDFPVLIREHSLVDGPVRLRRSVAWPLVARAYLDLRCPKLSLSHPPADDPDLDSSAPLHGDDLRALAAVGFLAGDKAFLVPGGTDALELCVFAERQRPWADCILNLCSTLRVPLSVDAPALAVNPVALRAAAHLVLAEPGAWRVGIRSRGTAYELVFSLPGLVTAVCRAWSARLPCRPSPPLRGLVCVSVPAGALRCLARIGLRGIAVVYARFLERCVSLEARSRGMSLEFRAPAVGGSTWLEGRIMLPEPMLLAAAAAAEREETAEFLLDRRAAIVGVRTRAAAVWLRPDGRWPL